MSVLSSLSRLAVLLFVIIFLARDRLAFVCLCFTVCCLPLRVAAFTHSLLTVAQSALPLLQIVLYLLLAS